MCLEQILEFSTALLTPLIAVVATYIAWQQWKTNQQKLMLERYDRRLRVYEEVRKILSIILRESSANYVELQKFYAEVSEADFLFDSEIPAYINEIYMRGVKLQSHTNQNKNLIKDGSASHDHSKALAGMQSEFDWFTEQYEPAKQMFKKYLDISK